MSGKDILQREYKSPRQFKDAHVQQKHLKILYNKNTSIIIMILYL